MKLMLAKKIPGLGDVGDVVEISDGYGRNYLIPQRLGVPNTPENRRIVETKKLVALQQETERQERARLTAKEMKNALMQVFMRAQDDGTLYGSVTAGIVVAAIEEAKGLKVDERWLVFPGTIKKIGDYDVDLKLPGELGCSFKLTVLPEEE